jgi:DNA-directed RNA polymerase specialized sigma24 family protein
MIIINAINCLSEIEKEVVLLRIIKGYPVSDVSIVLDRPEEVIKKLQFNAMKKISLEINKNKFVSGKFAQYDGAAIQGIINKDTNT